MNCLAKRTPAFVDYAVAVVANESKIAKKEIILYELYERVKNRTRETHGNVNILPQIE